MVKNPSNSIFLDTRKKAGLFSNVYKSIKRTLDLSVDPGLCFPDLWRRAI